MAVDGLFLHLAKNEILSSGDGLRIAQIHQPTKDDVTLSMRYRGGQIKILISASPSSARIGLAPAEIINPPTPPMFCVLLRKYLAGAKLLDIKQVGLDRVIIFEFEGTSSIGDLIYPKLIVEVMGRHSNIILVDNDDLILGTVRRNDISMSSARLMMPGVKYQMLDLQNKLNILDTDIMQCVNKILATDKRFLSKSILSELEGFSPVISREISYRSTGGDIGAKELTPEMVQKLEQELEDLKKLLNSGKGYFNIVKNEGELVEFSFMPLKQYGSAREELVFDSALITCEEFFRQKDRTVRVKQRTGDLIKLVNTHISRVHKRLDTQRSELLNSIDREPLKIKGDILMSNLYSLKKGNSVICLDNYYTDPVEKLEIKLDPAKTPSQNAQKYYSDYRKAATAERKLVSVIAAGEQELSYLETVSHQVEQVVTAQDIGEIKEELTKGGYMRARYKTKNKMRSKKIKPFFIISKTGFKIYIGKNNHQNDLITTKLASSKDIWFHAKDMPGSHVVVITGGEQPDSDTLVLAAHCAAYNSKGKNSSKVPVDFVAVKYVKKPSGAKPGMVIYTDYETLFITPDTELLKSYINI